MTLRVKPATRLSLGLILLTVSILFASDMLGLMPNAVNSKLEARKKLCEALAVQFSSAVNNGAERSINETITAVVKRNDDVLSAALRMADGLIVSRAGDHELLWQGDSSQKSNTDNVVVPIFKNGEPWASVEVRFAPLRQSGINYFLNQSFVGLIAFVSLLGFFGYRLFMRRALRELDPSGVIPARVKAAFDALAEGVLILDEYGQIVLANAVFLDKAQRPLDYLLGRNASTLQWSWPDSDKKPGAEHMPWNRVFADGKSHTGVRLTLAANTEREQSIFMVNSAPISDDQGNSRGVLSTFDDVTELERKNSSLQHMLAELEKSQQQVETQNRKLQVLATRDPLTNCLNRRAMNEEFEPLFERAKEAEFELSCLMVDIDHFKTVNDTFGHSVGDHVIKTVAEILKSNTREVDLVSRYGGEEFCVVLPGIQIEMASGIADRIRREIESGGETRFAPLQQLTASFGVASAAFGADSTEALVGEADKALYFAKSSGRNRVVSWNSDLQEDAEGTEQDGYLDDLIIGEEASNDDNISTVARQARSGATSLQASDETANALADDITALSHMPEKALFCDRIDQALSRCQRQSGVAAVMSLSLDIFRRINYTLGPEAGNRLLLETAARLNHILRDSDSVALIAAEQTSPTILQLNGDEFGILLTDVVDVESITWIVKRIFEVLSKPVDIAGHKVGITANIGVSVYPADGECAEVLLKNASIARHHAQKASGPLKFQFFSEELNQKSVRQLELESDLLNAIENEEFELYYQPKVCLKEARITGFEALVRWNHPTKGLVAPNDFIPIAEKTQMINVIGDWVLREAMEQTASWNRCLDKELTIAVNLSPVQFQQKQLVDQVLSMAVAARLNPELLVLEITESTVVEDVKGAIKVLNKLRDHGVKVALDDFGTGYSALNYLKQLPLDSLKIDRSFIMGIAGDERDASIVATIINLAQSLDLTVVAEGVESHDELALLCNMNCDEIQGYLFSRPVPVENVSKLLNMCWRATFEESKVARLRLAGSQ